MNPIRIEVEYFNRLGLAQLMVTVGFLNFPCSHWPHLEEVTILEFFDRNIRNYNIF